MKVALRFAINSHCCSITTQNESSYVVVLHYRKLMLFVTPRADIYFYLLSLQNCQTNKKKSEPETITSNCPSGFHVCHTLLCVVDIVKTEKRMSEYISSFALEGTDSIKSALDAIVVLAHSHRCFFKFQLFADFSLSRLRQCWSETWREGWKLKTFFSSSSFIVLCGDYMRNLFGSFSFSSPPPSPSDQHSKSHYVFFRHRTKRNLSRRLANPKAWVGQKGTIKNQMIDGHQSKKYVRETHRHVRAHNTAAAWRQPTIRCSRGFFSVF